MRGIRDDKKIDTRGSIEEHITRDDSSWYVDVCSNRTDEDPIRVRYDYSMRVRIRDDGDARDSKTREIIWSYIIRGYGLDDSEFERARFEGGRRGR